MLSQLCVISFQTVHSHNYPADPALECSSGTRLVEHKQVVIDGLTYLRDILDTEHMCGLPNLIIDM